MLLVCFLCFSVVAGWAVNLIADTMPKNLPIWQNWNLPFKWFTHSMHSDVDSHNSLTIDNSKANSKLFWRHLAVWVLTPYLACTAYMASANLAHGIVLSVLSWCFLTIAVIDIEHRRVLNRFLLWMLPIIFVSNLALGLPSLGSSVLGGIAGFSLFLALAIAWPGGMGMGDVKLAGIIGLATGVSGVMVALLVGILSGGIAAMAILLATRMRSRATMAYAPYLVFGAWIALYSGANFWPM